MNQLTKISINTLSLALCLMLFARCEGAKDTHQADTASMPQAFNEQHRPQLHFTPPAMWCNDPNGMVYHNGEYHLFYQHYPDSIAWGPMHWGHAVSKDLIHWEHLPIALYPDEKGYIFSGSAVVDKDNTSGLGTQENPPLIAIFTYHDMVADRAGATDYESQGIAYSLDNGRSWTKYDQNPVLDNPGNTKDFRDPKVFWHSETQKWIMVLSSLDHIKFYDSKNLLSWNLMSEFGRNEGNHTVGVWECSDLFPLKDEEGNEHWILIVNLNDGTPSGGSGTQYFVGQFDGTKFTNANSADTELYFDWGRDNFAGITWANVPETQNRTVFLGWMANWNYARQVPTEAWRNGMTLPRELSLSTTAEGPRLAALPVPELDAIRGNKITLTPTTRLASMDLAGEVSFPIATSEIKLSFQDVSADAKLEVALSNTRGQRIAIGYEASTNRYYIDRTNSGKSDFADDFAGVHWSPRYRSDRNIDLHLIFDVASVELFADEGEVNMTDLFFPDEDYSLATVKVLSGSARLSTGEVTSLKSIW